jgi:hypothetical protein
MCIVQHHVLAPSRFNCPPNKKLKDQDHCYFTLCYPHASLVPSLLSHAGLQHA